MRITVSDNSAPVTPLEIPASDEAALEASIAHAMQNPPETHHYKWDEADADGSGPDSEADVDTTVPANQDGDDGGVDSTTADLVAESDGDVESPPDPSTPPTPEAPELLQIGQYSFTPEQTGALEELITWAQSLPPEAHAAINGYLSGTHVLVDVNDYQQPQVPVQGSGMGAPAPVPVGSQAGAPTAPAPLNPDDYLDPAMARELQAMRDQLAAIQQQTVTVQQQTQQQQAAAIQARQAAAYEQALEVAKYSMAQDFGCDDADLNALINVAARMQITPALVAANPNAPHLAFRQALETAYFADPTFRSRELDRIRQQEAADAQATAERKRRASSLSPTGAPVPRDPAPIRRPANRQEQVDAMEQAILSAQGNGN